jgi:hypothetical protein
MKWSDVRRDVAAATAPSTQAIGRVREGLSHRAIPSVVRAEPSPSQVKRLAMRIDRRRHRRTPRLGLAAAFAVPVLVAATAVVALWPSTGPNPVALDLSEAGAIEVSEHIGIDFEGDGALGGTDRDLQIAWTTGRITIEVEPHQGIEVEVTTSEGVIRVVGTAFTVDRTDLGTSVSVERGRVEVDCHGGNTQLLDAAEVTLCLPTSAGGMLVRGRLLDSPDDSLEAAEIGMRLHPDGDTRAELTALQFESLLKLGRFDEAVGAAGQYIHLGGPRTTVRRYGSTYAASPAVSCETAMAYVSSLSEPTADERAAVARCSTAEGRL